MTITLSGAKGQPRAAWQSMINEGDYRVVSSVSGRPLSS